MRLVRCPLVRLTLVSGARKVLAAVVTGTVGRGARFWRGADAVFASVFYHLWLRSAKSRGRGRDGAGGRVRGR